MLQDFFASCKKYEPHNASYFIENARLFSQLASFSMPVLAEAIKFAKFATELEIDNAEYLTDVAKIHLLMGNLKEAQQEFRTATDMDKTSIPALYGEYLLCYYIHMLLDKKELVKMSIYYAGLISCKLVEGNVDDANQQLEFLREMASSIDKSPELLYLSAIVARAKNQSMEVVVKFLGDALESHFAKMKGFAFNINYLKLINPDLVLKIVNEYLQFAPEQVTITRSYTL